MRRVWGGPCCACGRVRDEPARIRHEAGRSLRDRGHSVAVVLASLTTFALKGIDSLRVTVEVDVRQGLPSFSIVGLGDRAVREARERVRAAVQNSGFEFPARRVVVNLAPAYVRKVGAGFDLAIACGVLAASGQLPADSLAQTAVLGELS